MQFKTGDIVKARVLSMPNIIHSGIVLMRDDTILVAHNTPSKKNPAGGNTVIETMNAFLDAGREIIRVRETQLNYEQIMNAFHEIKHVPFNLLEFNCDDFVYYVRTGKRRSSLLTMFKKRLLRNISAIEKSKRKK